MTGAEHEGRATTQLLVMSWNLRAFRDSTSAIAEALHRVQPDVLLAQELPRQPGWRSRVARMEHATHLKLVAGGGAGARGTGVFVRDSLTAHPVGENPPLSRVPVLASLSFVSPPGTRRLSHRPLKEFRLHRRAMAQATVSAPDLTIDVVSIHLGLDDTQRRRHVAELDALLQASPRAVIVGGDFNERPEGAAWQYLAARMTDVTATEPATFPAKSPRSRIDTIFFFDPDQDHARDPTPDPARGPIRVTPISLDALLEDVPAIDDLIQRATDHRPVLVGVGRH